MRRSAADGAVGVRAIERAGGGAVRSARGAGRERAGARRRGRDPVPRTGRARRVRVRRSRVGRRVRKLRPRAHGAGRRFLPALV
ncbi:hypothetical protein E5163_07675 [Marinicauda algicola]|uniref:Uncharacterized protein n=1 Tax=Marinicauda algicola TaxID=2029849 RepID=A0A4S2H0T3_9PROT|nr:hypothetical protein E5163_07675 [Marinicauda algicola]